MDSYLAFVIAIAIATLAIGCSSLADAASAPPADRVAGQRPNIVLIVADDMGWDDISFHGSDQIPTPNIDALHAYGVALQRHYTAPLCTPTRSSLLTGRYPSAVGMQHHVVLMPQPWGLGLEQKIMPEYLKEVGYRTHLVGKWHLGFHTARNTPPARGYDTFFGCYGGSIDYYNHSAGSVAPGTSNGFDIRDQWDVSHETLGRYATDLFTDVALQRVHQHVSNNVTAPLFLQITYTAPHAGSPSNPLQAPPEIVEEFAHIRNPQRSEYAAMVTSLDRNIGRVMSGLDEAGLLENSVIIFFADNGAPVQGFLANSGSNFPQRGQKHSPWDGGVHNLAAIWSPLLKNKERVSNDLLHVSDWLPTIAHIASANVDRELDGHNQWDTLSLGTPSTRSDVLINVDALVPYTSYISGRYKYISGTTANGSYDGWLSGYNDRSDVFPNYNHSQAINDSPTARALKRFSSSPDTGIAADRIKAMRAESTITCTTVPQEPTDSQRQCRPLEGPCLFDILRDPCEYENLANVMPTELERLQNVARHYYAIAAKPRNQPFDPRSNPVYFNNTWTRWYDRLGPRTDGLGFVLPDTMLL